MKNFIAIVILASVLLISCASGGTGKQSDKAALDGSVKLDMAIGDFSIYVVERRLPTDTLTAIAVMNAPVQSLGNYITDKLSDSLLNGAGLRMVSRQDVDRIMNEQVVQAGAFDDNSTARMGQNLGWHTIILGAVEPMTEAYHLSLRAVDVETGELKGSKSYVLVGNDPILINLVNPAVSVQRLEERETILVPFEGKKNDFSLNVSTNKQVYYDGETMLISLVSSIDCYFVVYHVDIENNMQIIFPNSWEKGTNSLQAGVPRVIPENTDFVLHAPFGEERILVFASDQPINIPNDQYRARSISKDNVASTHEALVAGSRGMSVKAKGATAQVSYSILPR